MIQVLLKTMQFSSFLSISIKSKDRGIVVKTCSKNAFIGDTIVMD